MLSGIWVIRHPLLYLFLRGTSLEEKIGILPVTETIFTTFNILLAIITLVIITIINPLMRPTNKEEIREIDTNVFRFHKNEDIPNLNQGNRTFAQVIENNRFFSLFVGFSLFVYIFYFFNKNGFSGSKYCKLDLSSFWTYFV